MARKRLHKVMIDEVLRLKRLGFSQRKIARQLGVARVVLAAENSPT